VTTQLHFTKDALALHLLLKRLERLVYIVVAYNYMHRQLPRVGVKTVQIKCCQGCQEAEAKNKTQQQVKREPDPIGGVSTRTHACCRVQNTTADQQNSAIFLE